MARYIVTGSYTAAAMKGMIAKPSDRGAATGALIAAAGGKMESYYLTTGDNDFTMTVVTDDQQAMLAALMVAGGLGRGDGAEVGAGLHLGRVPGGAEGRRSDRGKIFAAGMTFDTGGGNAPAHPASRDAGSHPRLGLLCLGFYGLARVLHVLPGAFHGFAGGQ